MLKKVGIQTVVNILDMIRNIQSNIDIYELASPLYLHPGENFRYEVAVDYGPSFKLQEIHIYFGDVFAGAYLINVFLESENVNTDLMINFTNNTHQVYATSMDSKLYFWPISTMGAN